MTSEKIVKTWWTTRDHTSGYIPDEVKLLLDQYAAEARKDQAEICADAVGNVPTHQVATIANGNAIRGLIREDLAMKACLNAVKEADE